MNNKIVMWFDELQLKDIPEAGGKNASLGEMRRNLQKRGVNIPDGYAITAAAYRHLIASAGIWDKVKEILKDLDRHDMLNLSTRGKKVRDLIYNAPVPKDLPDASFAGQQETFLNIRGEEALIDACKVHFEQKKYAMTNTAVSCKTGLRSGPMHIFKQLTEILKQSISVRTYATGGPSDICYFSCPFLPEGCDQERRGWREKPPSAPLDPPHTSKLDSLATTFIGSGISAFLAALYTGDKIFWAACVLLFLVGCLIKVMNK